MNVKKVGKGGTEAKKEVIREEVARVEDQLGVKNIVAYQRDH